MFCVCVNFDGIRKIHPWPVCFHFSFDVDCPAVREFMFLTYPGKRPRIFQGRFFSSMFSCTPGPWGIIGGDLMLIAGFVAQAQNESGRLFARVAEIVGTVR